MNGQKHIEGRLILTSIWDICNAMQINKGRDQWRVEREEEMDDRETERS